MAGCTRQYRNMNSRGIEIATRQGWYPDQLSLFNLSGGSQETDMKEIKLTQGQVSLVDDEDFEKLNQFNWYANKDYNTFYAMRVLPRNGKPQRKVRMHHIVNGFPPKGKVTDHRDGDGLNNQKYNLRDVTNRHNGQNRQHSTKKSIYPGVFWHTQNLNWKATIHLDGKTQHIGSFNTEEKAFKAYKQKVETLGERVIDEGLYATV